MPFSSMLQLGLALDPQIKVESGFVVERIIPDKRGRSGGGVDRLAGKRTFRGRWWGGGLCCRVTGAAGPGRIDPHANCAHLVGIMGVIAQIDIAVGASLADTRIEAVRDVGLVLQIVSIVASGFTRCTSNPNSAVELSVQ